ncbi:MAG: hypothetical protein IKF49_10245 [Clostridia bacterium]|nr:hypothetical protein [Clostridia bacterium]
MNDGPLLTDRSYPAAICCNLTNGRMPHQGCGFIREEVPCIAYSDGDRIVVATDGTAVTYKYFAFTGKERAVILLLAVQGLGTLNLYSDETPIGTMSLSPHAGYETVRIPIKSVTGTSALSFYYQGKDPVRFREFSFETV